MRTSIIYIKMYAHIQITVHIIAKSELCKLQSWDLTLHTCEICDLNLNRYTSNALKVFLRHLRAHQIEYAVGGLELMAI